jgi:lipopolysaccharide transport system ATP-binding protein
LKDVSFEVELGEVVGIIGRNGAGKSTLLKILSRITEPTSGRCKFRGRIGSLLEVGTGFHPELTGRENIYLNGSILGMSRREIDRKFDEIVAFTDVERFLDTPVKRYSSGMFVRLGFAVAAHLEPEILVVDEVLAVGDAAFQKRCLGKMKDVSQDGRTILLVSHNMATLEALCSRCILLENGTLRTQGPTHEVISDYLRTCSNQSSGRDDLTVHRGRSNSSVPVMTSLTLCSEGKRDVESVRMGADLEAQVGFDLTQTSLSPVLGVAVKSSHGHTLFGINNRIIPGCRFDHMSSRGMITCRIEKLPLMPGTYYLDLYFGDDHRDIDVILEAASFDVQTADVFRSGKIPPESAGPIFVPATFSIARI